MATHKLTGAKRAVKVISKSKFSRASDKKLHFSELRNEIEVMRKVSGWLLVSLTPLSRLVPSKTLAPMALTCVCFICFSFCFTVQIVRASAEFVPSTRGGRRSAAPGSAPLVRVRASSVFSCARPLWLPVFVCGSQWTI